MSWAGVRILGGIHLYAAGGTRQQVGGRLAERLLGALVVGGERGASIDVLVDALWGDQPPPDPVPPLRMAVSRLRQPLREVERPVRIVADHGTYRLDAPRSAVDAYRFTDLVAEARALVVVDADRSASLYEAAFALWHGEPFGSMAHEAWAVGAVAELNELRLSGEEERADLDLARHRETIAVSRLRRGVREQPFRERRWVQLATVLYRLGRQAEALRAVEDARTILREELGVDVGGELREVEHALLAHDPELLHGPSLGGRSHDTTTTETLVGRDRDVDAVLRLVRANRMVCVHGLGGVGKSALVRVVASRLAADGWAVAMAELDGLDDRDALSLTIGDALGLTGASSPAELATAAAGRGVRTPVVLVMDGAESGAETVAVTADAFAALAPEVRIVVTSRVPIGASGEVRHWLGPLAIEVDGQPGPAVELYVERAGSAPEQAGSGASADGLVRACRRTAGLPLAIELAAATSDLVAGGGAGPDGEALGDMVDDAVRGAVGWSLGVLPGPSRELLATVAVLTDGLPGDALGARTSLGVAPADHRRVLAPLLQARLVTVRPGRGPTVRYHSLGPIREVIDGALSGGERSIGRRRAVELLTEVAAAVGSAAEQRRVDAVPAIECEMANVRQWVTRTVGTDAGLRLVTAMAPAMQELGLGEECARWLDAHLDGARTRAPRLWAEGTLAASGVRGIFSGPSVTLEMIEDAASIVAAETDWRRWAALAGRGALARAWAGDVAGAQAVIEGDEVERRLRDLDDPWMWCQRDVLRSIVRTQAGDVDGASAAIHAAIAASFRLEDVPTLMSCLYLLSFGSRILGDHAESIRALHLARELCGSGVGRGTQALVMADLAQHARSVGDAGATADLAAAIDDLERSGKLQAAAMARRDLGLWRLADGDPEGVFDLQACVPTLLRRDRRAATPALVELAAHLEPAAGSRLAAAAARLLDEPGSVPLPIEDRRRVVAALEAAGVGGRATDAGPASPLTDEEILALVHEVRPLSTR